MSRSALTRERRWWQIRRTISNSEGVIDEKLDEIDVPEKKFFLPGLEGQRLTHIVQLAHHWIRNVPSYPLVSVAQLYHTHERDGAGVAPPPPPGAFSFREKGGASEG